MGCGRRPPDPALRPIIRECGAYAEPLPWEVTETTAAQVSARATVGVGVRYSGHAPRVGHSERS